MSTSARKKISFYEGLVFTAYGFYILLGLLWLGISFKGGGHFNIQAFFLSAVFGVQAYFRNLLVNLILGIISLALSIFMLLEEIASANLFAPGATFDGLTKALLGFSFFSMAMSLILIFSYTKLGFKDK